MFVAAALILLLWLSIHLLVIEWGGGVGGGCSAVVRHSASQPACADDQNLARRMRKEKTK